MAEHRDLNGLLFGGRLSCPTFALSDAKSRLGQWSASSRTLELSRSLLVDLRWGALVEVLKHEMAHQYVDEVLGEREEAAHGPAFRAGVQGARHRRPRQRCSLPTEGAEPAREELAALEKISRLLSLASSPNEHEAQAAMAAAQRLM